jgi:hypothetical protein
MGFLGAIADVASSVVDTVEETASDAYEGASETVSDVSDTVGGVASGVSDTVGGVVDDVSSGVGGAVDTVTSGVGDVVGGAVDGVSSGVGGLVDQVSSGVGGLVDNVSSGVGGVVDGASGMVGKLAAGAGDVVDTMGEVSVDAGGGLLGALGGLGDKGRGILDTVGDNNLGFGVDLLSKLAPASGFLKGAGAVTGPAGLISCGLGMVDDLKALDPVEEGQSGKDLDWNSFLSNGVGTLGGLATVGATAAGEGTLAAGAMGPAGSVLGSLAAGLLTGKEMAEAADSDCARDDKGKTNFDYTTEAGAKSQRWLNKTLGVEEDNTAGMVLGGTVSGLGSLWAGQEGAARAAANWSTEPLQKGIGALAR